jgi:hypothetical protein
MSAKWWDMSDDELDDLFREASEKGEIPFDSSALDKLRQKIDFKPISQPSQGFKKRWLALSSLLVFFGVVLVYLFHGRNDDSTLEKRSNIISKSELSSSTNDKVLSSFERKQDDVYQKKDLNKSENLSSIDESVVIFDRNSSSKRNESKGNSTNSRGVIENKITPNEKSSNKKRNEQEIKSDYSLNKKPFDKDLSNNISPSNSLKNRILDISDTKSFDGKTEIAIPESKKSQTDVVEINGSNSEENSYSLKAKKKISKFQKSLPDNARVNDPDIHAEINNPFSAPFTTLENKHLEEQPTLRTNFYNVDFQSIKPTKSLETNIKSEQPTYVNTEPVVMNQPKFSRFGIRLAIAPEVSSIGKMETSAVIGSLFGLLVEYRLTKKLILQTGINYSKKIYTGDFEYYRAWTGGTGTGPKPISVDGTCKIIDIPINLRFDAFQMNRNSFFISGGISSYLMSDEVYTYNFASIPPVVRDWTGNSSSFYWSTLNLSLGVERKMNKHFTLQVEPFLKTPLTGVGRGMVNLYSSGLLFSTKYEF